MHWMTCTTCGRLVALNNTGICRGCQLGFPNVDMDDVYTPPLQPQADIDITDGKKTHRKKNAV